MDLTWGDEQHPKITVIGKGVTFDSGGLNIKPGAGMRQMKKDMGGAAIAMGLSYLIMAQDLPVRLRYCCPQLKTPSPVTRFVLATFCILTRV